MAQSYEYTNERSDHLKVRADPLKPGVLLTATQRHVEDAETTFVALSPGAAAELAQQLFLYSGRTGVIVMHLEDPGAFDAEQAAQAFLQAAGSSARVIRPDHN